MISLTRRTRRVYGLLATVWGTIIAWQVAEHGRVKEAARANVINRSKDIADVISGVIGSATFRGIVVQDRLESALNRLIKPGELVAAALLNISNEVVAYVGEPVNVEMIRAMPDRTRWGPKTVTFVNPVDLVITATSSGETNRPTIILPRRESGGSPREEERSRPPPREPPHGEVTSADPGSTAEVNPLPSTANLTNVATSNASSSRPERRSGRPRFGRPPWMSEEEHKSLLERRGLHGLVIVMSTDTFQRACGQDLWMRWIISCFAGISVAGLALAWRNVVKSSELQMRLLRASELNTHLKELNLAAAGLAHETRNPLNIIRGLAQMISKQSDTAPEVRKKSSEIIEEADRVAAQLGEFINYSRPREVRRAMVAIGSLIGEVVRALNYDIQDKNIQLQIIDDGLAVEADEQLLRQALFNLLLNAIQAVEQSGEIHIIVNRQGAAEAALEVRDNGPGVPADHRADIFKPYFTTHQNGTGLGLAVVQQIVLAHGWEIHCLANDPKGAIFRITHLRLATKPSGRAL